MDNEIKIKTPYGDKNWSYVKRVFDTHQELVEALEAWTAFWDDMPKGQLGNICCDIGLLNDAFIQTAKALANAKVET